eukprot:15465522-Alexandrium_andersonii.AAC.1
MGSPEGAWPRNSNARFNTNAHLPRIGGGHCARAVSSSAPWGGPWGLRSGLPGWGDGPQDPSDGRTGHRARS